jgi:hypothetical protein
MSLMIKPGSGPLHENLVELIDGGTFLPVEAANVSFTDRFRPL